MILVNFTPDTIPWIHVGVTGKIKPDEKIEVDDGRGRHILNRWGDRGLLVLQFGDEDKLAEKKADAMSLYTRFWTRQIVVFNQHNETLKNESKPYIMPPKELEFHAAKLGIELIGPWKVRKQVNDVEIKQLKDENAELRTSIKSLADMVKGLIKEVRIDKEPDVIERDTFTRKYKNKGKVAFKVWVQSNVLDIAVWPPERQDEVKVKWDSHGFDEEYPVDLMDVDLNITDALHKE